MCRNHGRKVLKVWGIQHGPEHKTVTVVFCSNLLLFLCLMCAIPTFLYTVFVIAFTPLQVFIVLWGVVPHIYYAHVDVHTQY